MIRIRLENARRKILASIKRFKINWRNVGYVGAIGLLTLSLNQDRPTKSDVSPNSLRTGSNSGVSEEIDTSSNYEPYFETNSGIFNSINDEQRKGRGQNLPNEYQIPDLGIDDSAGVIRSTLSKEEIKEILNSERWSPEEVSGMLGFKIGAEYVQLNGRKYLALTPKDSLTQEQSKKFRGLRVNFLVTNSNGDASISEAIYDNSRKIWMLPNRLEKGGEYHYIITDSISGARKIAGTVIN